MPRRGPRSSTSRTRAPGPAINDLVGGQVDLTLASGAASKPLLDGGKVKALAVTSAKRNPLLPQVPTVAEAGLVGFESIAGQGLFVPAGTPRDIVTKLNTEVNAIIKSPELTERWTSMGIDRVEQSPEQFAAWLAKESDQWAAADPHRRASSRNNNQIDLGTRNGEMEEDRGGPGRDGGGGRVRDARPRRGAGAKGPGAGLLPDDAGRLRE